jgi:uncharacterized zinc-type alcohol dehydrogenase-like protein
MVDLTGKPMPLNAFALMTNGRSIAGSQFAGVRETQEMLDFCAKHQVVADVGLIGADAANEAFKKNKQWHP